ncbi:MAG: hypothetical protein LUG99_08045 [Lachnospiraceae bacterium]|nr:hypothetical protein [Lachnospiraceae bacterium]
MSAVRKNDAIYEIMHMEQVVAVVSGTGRAAIFSEPFMPYDLYLEPIGFENSANTGNQSGCAQSGMRVNSGEEVKTGGFSETDWIDTMLGNLDNFYHWCASRILSLDRKYAKEIMNSLGVAQAVTDRDRAEITLSYHCVTLTDVFWVRTQGEKVTFAELNLYDNPLNEALVELSLRGRQMTVTNRELAPDLSTKGFFPKAWIRRNDGFWLLKDGDEDAVKRELAASRICQCFDIPQVIYQEYQYQGQMVTRSRMITSKEYSMVSKMAFDIYACNHDLDALAVCKELDPVTYYGMNILDYLTGNTDRHPENWGFLIDNQTNRWIRLYPLMDFNQCFLSYDSLDGAGCQTVLPQRMTQREAAIEAVRMIGLRQICDVDRRVFGGMESEAVMFERRFRELQAADRREKRSSIQLST